MIRLQDIYKNFEPYVDSLFNFIYPPYCVICNRRLELSKLYTCENCWQNLPWLHFNQLNNSKVDASSGTEISDFLSCISVWAFSDAVQALIHEIKYLRNKTLALSVGKEMGELAAMHREYAAADMVTPVPLHKTKLRERGYNQSQFLAESIVEVLKIPCRTDTIYRIRYTRSQSKLNAEQRMKNVQDAFIVPHAQSIEDKVVMLVDDVFTTGSTLKACARTLRDAGARKVIAITAAKTILNN